MRPAPEPLLPKDIESATADWIARRDAGLTAAEQAEFARWLAADPRHAQALARHRQAWALLDRPRTSGQATAMVAELRARTRQRRRQRLRLSAAGLAILLGVFTIWGPFGWRGAEASTHAIVVRPELRTLPDGTQMELRPGAEIAVDFSASVRRIVLNAGEAHFQVTKDAQRPFVVTAHNVEVRAVGTAFAVQLSSHQVDVLVTEGSVAVGAAPAVAAPSPAVAPPPAAEPAHVVVDAGNRVIVDRMSPPAARPAPQVTPIPTAELEERLAWRAVRLEFNSTRLAEAVALMNQHNRIQFSIADPALAEIEVSGYFRANNTDAFLHLLEGSLGVKAERRGDVIVLRKGEARD